MENHENPGQMYAGKVLQWGAGFEKRLKKLLDDMVDPDRSFETVPDMVSANRETLLESALIFANLAWHAKELSDILYQMANEPKE